MKRSYWLTGLAALAVLLTVASAWAALSPVETQRAVNPVVSRAQQMAWPYPDQNITARRGDRVTPRTSLGRTRGDGIGPGLKIGDTWYDYQHNGRMTRMVDWGVSDPEGFLIHFSWMHLPSDDIDCERAYAYNVFKGDSGKFLFPLGTVVPVSYTHLRAHET